MLIEHISVRWSHRIEEPAYTGSYDVLLSFQGEATVFLGADAFDFFKLYFRDSI
jgi:hypothetical protein